MAKRSEKEDEGGYRIGTVASLTGLDPHTIRAWERRYGAIAPGRSEGGTRFYSDADVERLSLIKALTECGDPVSRVAALPVAELRRRLAKLAKLPTAAAPDARALGLDGRGLRLAVLEPGLVEQLRLNAASASRLEVVLAEHDLEEFARGLSRDAADVLVLGLTSLGSEPLDALRRCVEAARPRLTLVVYSFARRRDLAQLAEQGAKPIRGPLSVPQLERTLLDLLVIEEARRQSGAPPVVEPPRKGKTPERLFSDRQLARLREISSSVDCECPNHLASLIASLAAFEQYSRQCESQDPVHASLHGRLALGTAQARAAVERLLAEVCEHDQIRL